MARRIYLDNAATTPMRPEAVQAVVDGMARWANPSSPHAEGRAARRALEDARARIAAALGWTGEVILTGGASEALAIALARSRCTRAIVAAAEHEAVFRAAPHAGVVPLAGGCLDDAALAAALGAGPPAIVAVQSINSETGTLLRPDADAIRAAGGLWLADCSQSAGKAPLPDADLIVVSAHKLGGPPGVGALLVRDFAMLRPTGGHEFGYRAGTENLPGSLAFAAALEAGGLQSWATTAAQRSGFRDRLAEVGRVLQPGAQCSHILAVASSTMAAAAQLIRLDAAGFAVSAGSACSSGTLKRSRALAAFGVADDVADRTIRVSIGWSTTSDELDAFADAYAALVDAGGRRAA